MEPRIPDSGDGSSQEIDIQTAVASLDPEMVHNLSVWLTQAPNEQHNEQQDSVPSGDQSDQDVADRELDAFDIATLDESILEQLGNFDAEQLAVYLASLSDNAEGDSIRFAPGETGEAGGSSFNSHALILQVPNVEAQLQRKHPQLRQENNSPGQSQAITVQHGSVGQQCTDHNTRFAIERPQDMVGESLKRVESIEQQEARREQEGNAGDLPESRGDMPSADPLKELSQAIAHMDDEEQSRLLNRLLQEIGEQPQSNDEAALGNSAKGSQSPSIVHQAEDALSPSIESMSEAEEASNGTVEIPENPEYFESWTANLIVRATSHLSAAASTDMPTPTGNAMRFAANTPAAFTTGATFRMSRATSVPAAQHRNISGRNNRKELRNKATDFERERVREENRERKKRWREVNQDRNKDNDLRCRITKRASKIFGETDSPATKAWMKNEFDKRRAKRQAKTKCHSGDDMALSTFTSNMTPHTNATSSDTFANNSNSNFGGPSHSHTQQPVLSPPVSQEGNVTEDLDEQRFATLLSSLVPDRQRQGHGEDVAAPSGQQMNQELFHLNEELSQPDQEPSNESNQELLQPNSTIEAIQTGDGMILESLAKLGVITDVDPCTLAQIVEVAKDIDLENIDPATIQEILQQSLGPDSQAYDPDDNLVVAAPADEEFRDLLQADPRDVAQLLRSVSDKLGTSEHGSTNPIDVHNGFSSELTFSNTRNTDSSTGTSTPNAPPPTPVTTRKRSFTEEITTTSPHAKRHQTSFAESQQVTNVVAQAPPPTNQQSFSVPRPAPYATQTAPAYSISTMNQIPVPKPPLVSKPRTATAAHAASFGNSATMNQRLMMPPAYRPTSSYNGLRSTSALAKKKPDEKIVRSMGFPPMLAGLKKQ